MWNFYVYHLVSDDGTLQYVGKGSGTRLKRQMTNRKLDGYEVARFKREKDAYAFEVDQISSEKPLLNVAKGGNGSKATRQQKPRLSDFEKICLNLGTRVVAARMWLSCVKSGLCDVSKVDEIRRVAYG